MRSKDTAAVKSSIAKWTCIQFQDYAARWDGAAEGLVAFQEQHELWVEDGGAGDADEPKPAYFGLDGNVFVAWGDGKPRMKPEADVGFEDFLSQHLGMDEQSVQQVLACYGETAELPKFMPLLALPPAEAAPDAPAEAASPAPDEQASDAAEASPF